MIPDPANESTMRLFSSIPIDWNPFRICAPGEKAPYPRALSTPEGLGDRLRFVAFAEKQATHAFASAAEIYVSASEETRSLWRTLALEEEKHLGWLLNRMKELSIDASERPVNLALWNSFDRCQTPMQFAEFMANAEERGRVAGEQFFETLLKIDPVTAELFRVIADEEKAHIQLASEGVRHLLASP